MQLSIPDNSFLDSFEHLGNIPLDPHGKNELNLFMLRINANEFDYALLVQNLLEPVITYSISRKVKSDYSNKPHTLTKKAIEKFVNYCNNTGELNVRCSASRLFSIAPQTLMVHHRSGINGPHLLV